MALSKIIENSLADEAVSSAKLKDFAAAVDLNGVELVLDADADTSIKADTDDRIDFKIANVEHFFSLTVLVILLLNRWLTPKILSLNNMMEEHY